MDLFALTRLSVKMKIAAVVFLAVLIAVVCAIFMPFFPLGVKKGQPFIVRVRIAHDRVDIQFSAEARCAVTSPEAEDAVKQDMHAKTPVRVASVAGGIQIGGETFAVRRIRIEPVKGFITVNGREYRGSADIVKEDNDLDVINIVGLEDYLKGVLPCEVNSLWPSSALKAQAIASRSFAVSAALRRRSSEYDLTDDTFSQVYAGKSRENWRTSAAVRSTAGKVLMFDGKILPAYFHSCCGGHTESAARLWTNGSEPLDGVRCPWCRWTPYFRWQTRIPTEEILDRLKQAGYDIRRIDDIRPGEEDPSGRLEYVRIKTGTRWFDIKADEFIRVIGTRKIRSTKMRVKKYPFFYYFSGYGWGHGVGMCQWGAFSQALRWWGTERILKYYYPGSKVVDLGTLLSAGNA